MISLPPEDSEQARLRSTTAVDTVVDDPALTAQRVDVAPEGSDPFPDHFESYRPLRGDGLRGVLDEEFQKSYRFEGLSNVFHDIKELFRKVVTRDDEDADIPGMKP